MLLDCSVQVYNQPRFSAEPVVAGLSASGICGRHRRLRYREGRQARQRRRGARILGGVSNDIRHFDPAQVLAILGRLRQRDCCLVLLDSVLGLRRGELALRWEDCDFDNSKFLIRRSWDWRTSREGKPKTENSVKQLPMNPVLHDALLKWKQALPSTSPETSSSRASG